MALVSPVCVNGKANGKAQDAYAFLAPDLSLDYGKVKAAVLRAYELLAEAYCQFKKTDTQT